MRRFGLIDTCVNDSNCSIFKHHILALFQCCSLCNLILTWVHRFTYTQVHIKYMFCSGRKISDVNDWINLLALLKTIVFDCIWNKGINIGFMSCMSWFMEQ